MNGIVLLVLIFVVFAIVLATIAFLAYRRVLRRAKGVERGLKMVPLLIHLPPPSDDTEDSGNRDVRDIMREKISQAQVLYDLIAGTAQAGFKSNFYGQRHIAFEIIASNGLIHYFAAVPVAMVDIVEQAIVSAYPGARLEEVEDHNIFNPQGHLTGTVGGELVLKHQAAYPIGTLDQMERDPMVGLLNALSKLQLGDGAAIQIMLRPAGEGWTKNSIKLVDNTRHTRRGGLGFGVADIAKGAVKTSEEWREDAKSFELSKLEEDTMQRIEEKTKHPGYEVLIRILASSPSYDRSQILLRNITTAFALFEAPGSNGFQFVEGRDMQGLVTAFIFRFFPPELSSNVLNSVEMATLFHLPDAQFTPSTQVERQKSKQVDGPVSMSQSGLLFGYNFYRGVKKEVRLGPEDRRRHTYIVGQTGTGKSTILENLAVQDMLAGNGFAFIDPHGDTAEKLISMVPKERAEDVVYFNPGDMDHPLGLNLFEYSSPEQKDFLVQESINMLYKLYDPGKTGIIGPRFEHWFRNAALTLMADPNGSSFVEIPKVFTDTAYLKNKFKYLNDPTVIEFWTKEMAQTSDYHKSEMLGWFVSKFGAFLSNEMMRNIIGQTHSGFNIRDIMDKKKILIVNLGKGLVGEQNSQLLGMIFIIKFQAAAMSRSNIPEDQRQDFSLYVDEFQNFSTDSFASILSEARKYRLNLIVANQYISQLSDEIRDAVFGNVGTMLSYRTGPEDAEFLVKQFEPIFDQRDLVNMPNFNAVMKLLIGGLPSQPFSITMLPSLGQAHAEMGLAIKQLSAAKFGVPRATVEADIFARLQGTPPPIAPPAPVAPPPAPSAAPSVPASVNAASTVLPPPSAASASPAVPPASVLPPSRPSSPVPPVASSPAAPAPPDGLSLSQLRATSPQPAPPAAATPATPQPAAAPAPVSTPSTPSEATPAAPVTPPAVVSAPAAPAVSEPAPINPVITPPTPAPALPSAPPASAPVSSAVSVPPKVPPSQPQSDAATRLPAAEAKPAPVVEVTPSPAPKPKDPALLIEAHETDGKVSASEPPKPVVLPEPEEPMRIEAHETDGKKSDSPTDSVPAKKPVQTKPLLRIEAHETDGKVDVPKPSAQAPVAEPPPPPEPKSAPSAEPKAAVPQAQESVPVAATPIPEVKPAPPVEIKPVAPPEIKPAPAPAPAPSSPAVAAVPAPAPVAPPIPEPQPAAPKPPPPPPSPVPAPATSAAPPVIQPSAPSPENVSLPRTTPPAATEPAASPAVQPAASPVVSPAPNEQGSNVSPVPPVLPDPQGVKPPEGKSMIATHKGRVLNRPSTPHPIDPNAVAETVEEEPAAVSPPAPLPIEHLPNDLPKGITFKNPTIDKHSEEPAQPPSAYVSAAVPKPDENFGNDPLHAGHHELVLQPPKHEKKSVLEELADDEAAAQAIIDAAKASAPPPVPVPPVADEASAQAILDAAKAKAGVAAPPPLAPAPPVAPVTLSAPPVIPMPVPAAPPAAPPAPPSSPATPVPSAVPVAAPPSPPKPLPVAAKAPDPAPAAPAPKPAVSAPVKPKAPEKPSAPAAPAVASPAAAPASSTEAPPKGEAKATQPALKPGEIYIDDQGNVVQG